MTDSSALQRLLTWLSPAFPVGGFAYSAGLETAIVEKQVVDADSLSDWIAGNLSHGSACTDATILVHAFKKHTDTDALRKISDLCIALTPSRQRCEELVTMGDAFVAAAQAWPSNVFDDLPSPCPYPVAIGAISAANRIECDAVITAFLTAYAHAQISVAIRLVPLGQTEGLRVLAALEPTIKNCTKNALSRDLGDIGSIGYASDIAAMSHETLRSRTFRS